MPRRSIRSRRRPPSTTSTRIDGLAMGVDRHRITGEGGSARLASRRQPRRPTVSVGEASDRTSRGRSPLLDPATPAEVPVLDAPMRGRTGTCRTSGTALQALRRPEMPHASSDSPNGSRASRRKRTDTRDGSPVQHARRAGRKAATSCGCARRSLKQRLRRRPRPRTECSRHHPPRDTDGSPPGARRDPPDRREQQGGEHVSRGAGTSTAPIRRAASQAAESGAGLPNGDRLARCRWTVRAGVPCNASCEAEI